ncbi:mpv17-like protein [Mercenaria mercenaria]|uniref:mpv17-like protein n=1 Tax=Mercenaria mercenaria TaxID=6596 RepID=UPI00234F5A36|nr:mpv17-like protein [Mercenaria mercenaria]
MVSRFIAKYPIVKTMGAYFCINVAADFNEQVLIKGRTKETYDLGKTARIAATCTFVTSPMMFVWIRFIDRAIPGKALLSVVKKVVADAFGFAPCVISTFYITTNILEGKKDLTAEWKQKFYPTWTTGLCYWPFVQTVNFAMIPLKYKTCLYMPTASFIWMNYLCYMKDKKIVYGDEEKDKKSVVAASPVLQSEHLTHVFKVPTETQSSVPHTFFQNVDIHTSSHRLCSETSAKELSKAQSSQPSGHCVQSDAGFSVTQVVSQQSRIQLQTDFFTHAVILSPY